MTSSRGERILAEPASRRSVQPQRVQVSLWYILIGYFGGLSIYHSDTWTLWVQLYNKVALTLCDRREDKSLILAPLSPAAVVDDSWPIIEGYHGRPEVHRVLWFDLLQNLRRGPAIPRVHADPEHTEPFAEQFLSAPILSLKFI